MGPVACGCHKLQFNQRKAATSAARFFASTHLPFRMVFYCGMPFQLEKQRKPKNFFKANVWQVLLKEAGFRQRKDTYFCQKACNSKKNAQKPVYFDT